MHVLSVNGLLPGGKVWPGTYKHIREKNNMAVKTVKRLSQILKIGRFILEPIQGRSHFLVYYVKNLSSALKS